MDTAIITIINVISSGGLIYLGNKLGKEKRNLREYEEAKVYSPSLLKTKMNQIDFRNSLQRSSESSNEHIIKCFIEGIVECKNPLKSQINGKKDLVYSYKFTKDIYSNDSIIELRGDPFYDFRTAIIKAPLYFSIKDANNNESCFVHMNSNVKTNRILTRVAEYTEMKKLSFIENIIVNIGRVVEMVGFLFARTFLWRGIRVGWTETELGITVGSILTVYGQVVYNAEDKTLKIDIPLQFIPDKATLIRKVKEGFAGIYWKMFLVSIPFTFSGFYLCNKLIKYYVNLKKRKEKEQLNKALENSKTFKEIDEDFKCIVCIEKPRNVIFKPCMHFSICKACYTLLHKKTCPICKKPIREVIDVILA